MESLLKTKVLTRRRFIVAAMALAGTTSVIEPGLLSLSRAWASSPEKVDEAVHLAMVKMARLLYPHDAIPDQVYASVLDSVLSDTAASAQFAKQIDTAYSALNEYAAGHWQNADEASQIKAMREIASEPYFQAIQNVVRAGIYNGEDFWKHIGYPGPSKDFGGYLHRGAGEIDWLPEES